MRTGTNGAGASGAGKSPPPWPLLLVAGPGEGPAWLPGVLPGSVPVEFLRQEPPKGGRTLGEGQSLLSDVATCEQWSES